MASAPVGRSRSGHGTAHLELLGGFALRLCGARANLGLDLPLQVHRLLAAVALTGTSSRSQLAGTLWPDVREQRARASLRTALWQLHRAGADIVSTSGPQLQLCEHVVLDVATLRTALALALRDEHLTSLQIALIRDGPDLLPGWYDDWVVYHRETILDQQLSALERMAAKQLRERQPASALLLAQAMAAKAPLRDSAYQLILRSHLALGNAADAVEQYHRYGNLLRVELGLHPSQQLRGLIEPFLTDRAVRRRPSTTPRDRLVHHTADPPSLRSHPRSG